MCGTRCLCTSILRACFPGLTSIVWFCFLNLHSAHIFSSWMCSVIFPPDKSSTFKSTHLYFIIIALLNAVSLGEGVLFLPLSSVESSASLYFPPISLRSWKKKMRAYILWSQVLEIHLLTK